MGSAALQFASDGSIAWDQIWRGFCDLAIAGGPPHKGRLLAPSAETANDAASLDRAQAELLRGLRLAAGMQAEPSPRAGFVRVHGLSPTFAGWLLRSITLENVAVYQAERGTIDLPCDASFRVEKEIKNVVTVAAKTAHYWHGHMPEEQRTAIGHLFTAMEREEPLVQPVNNRWTVVECGAVDEALWQARALVAMNHLARREERTLLLANHADEAVPAARLAHVRALWRERESRK